MVIENIKLTWFPIINNLSTYRLIEDGDAYRDCIDARLDISGDISPDIPLDDKFLVA